jgi:hypothetical protein
MSGIACLARISVFAALLLAPAPVRAEAWVGWFQWGTQGSYVHQFSHLLFAGAMLYFLREMYWSELVGRQGFRCLWWACWILVFWNLDAVLGHTLEWALANPVIMGEGLSRRLLMEDAHTWLFYIFKINHFFLLIPAFYLFYRSLKAFAQTPPGKES